MAPVHDHGDPERPLSFADSRLRDVHPLDRQRGATTGRGAAPTRPARPSGEASNATSPSIPAVLRPALTLRHLPHAQQRVRPGAQHQLLQVPDPLLRSPSCVAVKIRCRSRRTSSSPDRQSMASQSKARSSGPFTVDRPGRHRGRHRGHGVQLAPSVPVVGHQVFTGSPAHVSALSGPGIRGPVSGRLSATPAGGAADAVVGFLLPFGHRHSLLGHPVPPGSCASLTVGLPGHHPAPGPRRGFHVPHA